VHEIPDDPRRDGVEHQGDENRACTLTDDHAAL
jgi:hypothetical protein